LTGPERILEEVAAAVADGHRVDWPEVYRRLEGTDAAKAAAALEEVDSYGRESRSMSLATNPRQKLQPFLLLMIPMVGLQVLASVVGFIIGPGASISTPGWLLLIATAVFTAAGVVVAVAGRWDPRTAPLAGLFLSIASAPAIALTSFMGLGLVQGVSSAFVFEAFFPFFFWWFVERFPRVVQLERRGRWVSWTKSASLWIGSSFFVLNLVDGFFPEWAVPREFLPFALRSPTGGYWLTLLVLALPAPLVIFARLRHAEGEERRRARLFMLGLAVGILPMVCVVLVEILIPPWSEFIKQPRNHEVIGVILYGFLLTIPITLGHAAVARQALDLRFALGRAARAMLAKWFLWILAVLPWVILAAVLWLGREHSLSEVFQRPVVPFLVVLGVLGIVLVLFRDHLLVGVERRLYGPLGAPGAAIAAFTRRLSSVRDIEELAHVIGEQTPDLLQAESCSLLLSSEAEGRFLAPTGGCSHVDSDSAIVQLAAASSNPISTEERDRDSWLRLLPESDRLWVAEGDVRLVLPVVDAVGESRALIAIGPSMSGGVYSDSVRDLASTVASAVSMTLARLGPDAGVRSRASTASSNEPGGECVSCGAMAEKSGGSCGCGGTYQTAAIPHVLGGKFRLERVLGRGGMGVVYLARDLALDRLVALKTLPRMRSGSLMRLRREARSMASFVHPNLALIFGAETWRGVPVLVVEYLGGGTLRRRIGKGNDPVFVVELGIKLAGALSALHRKGLLHRDVKPANIGFSEQDEPKLLDFGLAQIVEDRQAGFSGAISPAIPLHANRRTSVRLTETSHVVGTPLYLSPEVLRGDDPSANQDLWALHVVLWEVLVGRHPLEGIPRDAALEVVRSGNLPSVREACRECPDRLAAVLDRGLDQRQSSRRVTAASIRSEFEDVLRELA